MRIFLIPLLLSLLAMHPAPPVPSPTPSLAFTPSIHLKIAAFNAEMLGRKKMKKPFIGKTLARIINRYDIILLQEIRDSSDHLPRELLNLVNREGRGTYREIVSKRLGRSSSKEQYLYFYRADRGLTVTSATVYHDRDDHFERPPFKVSFAVSGKEFSLIGLHARPDDAVNELNHLAAVYEESSVRRVSHEHIILGDLNVDCSYVSDDDYRTLDLILQGFSFGIAKGQDTTVTDSVCAYDNVVYKSQRVAQVGIFDFKSGFGLDYDAARAVSNHFPVEFELRL